MYCSVVVRRSWRMSAWIVLTSTRLRASVVPKEWRRLYILIGFRPAFCWAGLKAARISRSLTGPSRSSLANTKSSLPVAELRSMRVASARVSRGVIGIASESEVLVVSWALRTQLSWTRMTPAWKSTAPRVRPWASPGRRKPAWAPSSQKGFLKDAGGVLEQTVNLVGVVEVVAAQDALALALLVAALDLGQRVRLQPPLAHGIVEDGAEDVAVCVARLRRGRGREHPRLRRATPDYPAFGFQCLGGRVRDALRTLRVQRHDAVGAAAPVLPGAGHLGRQALRLGLARHLDGLAAGRLRRPAPDLHLADVLAFGQSLLRSVLAEDPEGLEVREVAAQPPVGEVTDRGIRAEVAVQELEHIVVAGDGGALEALLALALCEPPLDGLPERAFERGSFVRSALGLEATEDVDRKSTRLN